MESKYLVVEKEILPNVFSKIIEAKHLLSSGQVKTATQAAKQAGVSRTAFYKYKDKVFVFSEREEFQLITMNILLKDEAGVLSDLILTIATYGGNILTINQNIPSEGVAPVSISIRRDHMKIDADVLVEKLQEKPYILEAMVVKAE